MASTGGMNNLATLVKRLEAATSRLEDIANSTGDAPNLPTSEATAASAATGSVATTPSAAADPPVEKALPPAIQSFDNLVADELKSFTDKGGVLGGIVAEASKIFATAFSAQRYVLLVSTKSKKPDTEEKFMEIMRELQQDAESMNQFRETHRFSPEKNHLSMLSEGVRVVYWVTIDAAPSDFVDDALGGAQLYGNRILTEYRDKEQAQVDWVKSFVKLFGSLKSYIKQHYPAGLQWKSDGGMSPRDALKAAKEEQPLTNGTSTPAPPAGSGPPPPPPPPLPTLDLPPPGTAPVAKGSDAGDMNAVFNQLNRGEAVTSGLRKVDPSEMTHKNPSLRSTAPVPQRSDSSSSEKRGKSPAPPAKKQKPDSMRAKKPPRQELERNVWNIENFENQEAPVEVTAEKSQSVLISRCKSTTVRVNGKANAISIDNCTKLDLVVDSLVSSVGVVSTSGFRLQVLGTLPSIQLDKVDGANVFLSKESLKAEVYSSKCSSINITLPPESDDADSVELPVPEQIKTTVVDGKLVNEIVKQEG